MLAIFVLKLDSDTDCKSKLSLASVLKSNSVAKMLLINKKLVISLL